MVIEKTKSQVGGWQALKTPNRMAIHTPGLAWARERYNRAVWPNGSSKRNICEGIPTVFTVSLDLCHSGGQQVRGKVSSTSLIQGQLLMEHKAQQCLNSRCRLYIICRPGFNVAI
jgi:hypothetical protein